MNCFFKLKTFIIITFWVILCLSPPAISDESIQPVKPNRVIIFVSKNIKPYVEAADGMRDVLGEIAAVEVEVFILDQLGNKGPEELSLKFINEKDIALFVAIGPEAASFVWQSFKNEFPPKIYSIILNPEKVIRSGSGSGLCGIALNIPPQIQIKMIHSAFVSVRRVGIFYDPSNNEGFYLEAAAAASNLGMALVPLKVSAMKDIPDLLEKALNSVDCIWLIPDKTVISESIAQYIIKQSIIRDIPVIGYNQFFYESGAAMAFVFDYRSLGRQTGKLAEELISQQKSCTSEIPDFQVWLNGAVIQKLGIKAAEILEPPMMMGP